MFCLALVEHWLSRFSGNNLSALASDVKVAHQSSQLHCHHVVTLMELCLQLLPL